MHIHIAIFKWKDGFTRQDIARSMDKVRAVADRVPGIAAIYCGENTSQWNMGFTDAVVVLGTSSDAIDRYRTDALHVEAAAEIEAMELEGIGIDFEDS